jgi:hypothetical protein
MFAFIKPESVRQLLADHRSGRQDNHKLLFSLVMLEQWLRTISSNHQPVSEFPGNEQYSLSAK